MARAERRGGGVKRARARVHAGRYRNCAILRRGTASIEFSTIRTATQRRFIVVRCRQFTHLPVQVRGTV
jgi:hypothetical protein